MIDRYKLFLLLYSLLSRTCICDGSQVSSHLTVTYTNTSITLTQSGLPNAALFFQNILREHIVFQHSPNPPSVPSSVVMVTVSDGQLTSEPAYSEISVLFDNMRPFVLVEGKVRKEEVKKERNNNVVLKPKMTD